MTVAPHDSHLLDARGMTSPESLIFVAKAARYLSRGTRLIVRTDEASSLHDLPVWAAWSGHEVASLTSDPDGGAEAFIHTLVIHNGRQASDRSRPA